MNRELSTCVAIGISALAVVEGAFLLGSPSNVGSGRIGGEPAKESAVSEMARRLDNEDVAWQGTYFGLEAELGPQAKKVKAQAQACTKSELVGLRNVLLEGVRDPKRYVVCHLLLSDLFDPQQTFSRLLPERPEPDSPLIATEVYDFSGAKYDEDLGLMVNRDGRMSDLNENLVNKEGKYIYQDGTVIPGYGMRSRYNGLYFDFDDDGGMIENRKDCEIVYHLWAAKLKTLK